MNITILTKIFLIIIYSLLPPAIIAYTHKLIYKDKNKYGVHLQYISKYIITVSFLPLLFIKGLDLGVLPQNGWSVGFILITIAMALLGLIRAIKFKNVFFYNAGIMASFMEEILYRGIIYGLTFSIWKNQWVALGVSSLLFGVWHLKNYYWGGLKSSIIQLLYTALFYGPIFGIARIFTGDIYLAVLLHYLTDATCALAPDWMRGWLVQGGRGKHYDDINSGIN